MTELCKPDCPICGGLGWCHVERSLGDPRFGRLELCPNVNPLTVYGKLIGLSDQELLFSWKVLANVNGAGEIIETIERTLALGFGWIFIWGSFGLGKTTLLKTTTAEALRSGYRASYTRMVDIIDNLRAAYSTDNSSYQAETRLNNWVDVPVLCIDEFDRIRLTEFASDRRFALMDKRYEGAIREENITIMASNSDPRTLDGYLADRIFDGRFTVIHIEGNSVRPNIDSRLDERKTT